MYLAIARRINNSGYLLRICRQLMYLDYSISYSDKSSLTFSSFYEEEKNPYYQKGLYPQIDSLRVINSKLIITVRVVKTIYRLL